MQRKKEHIDGRIAEATIDKGLLVVLTGNGKGKSSSAFGMLARSVGHGLRCAVVQFIKGQWECGEQLMFQDNLLVEFHVMNTGFTWETQDRERDIAAAGKAWEAAGAMMDDPGYGMVILDELNIVLRYGYLPLAGVLATLEARRPDLHVVITGRNADEALIEQADLVTEMKLVKHPFRGGVKGQPGIEF